ncbi:YciI family protein [Micromonospora maritima]|uniref:YciI family protein n=1 Tax=Micromonospora maritima TaxID=986711 RepID=A0ABW7ZJG6_9ACTN
MRYALIICDDESDRRGPVELVGDPRHVAWIDYLDGRGITLLDGVRLRSSTDSTTVRARNGETLISDGPFVEAKEQIGGFALIECANLDDAIEAAARHPFAAHGVVEVRPVWDE